MPVYNGEKYLQDSIDSILLQSYGNFEFIIIDDSSIDKTWDILLQNSSQDERIVLVRNTENLGLVRTLNKGLSLARGEYIARQDADDISLAGRLEHQVKILDEQSACAMVSSNIQIISKNHKKPDEILKRACNPELVTWYLLFYNHIGGHSQVMYRKDIILSLGGYSEACPHIEDYELWCRLSRTGHRIIILPQIFLTYRRHSQSISSVQKEGQEERRCNQVKRNLEELLNGQIAPEDVKRLIGFWRGNYKPLGASLHHIFPSADKAELISKEILTIKKRFIERYQTVFSEVNLDEELDDLISKQFLTWLCSPLTSHHTVMSKIKITYYALPWCGAKVLGAWLIWGIRLPWDSGKSLFHKISKLNLFNTSLGMES